MKTPDFFIKTKRLRKEPLFFLGVGVFRYYPFGMQIPGRSYNSQDDRYGFNGQEKDEEIFGAGSTIYFGERIYSPRIGRFLSADPLITQEKKYPDLSPYQFASNTPIQAIDLDGLEASYTIKKTGFLKRPVIEITIDIKVIDSRNNKDAESLKNFAKDYKQSTENSFSRNFFLGPKYETTVNYTIVDEVDPDKDFYIELTDDIPFENSDDPNVQEAYQTYGDYSHIYS